MSFIDFARAHGVEIDPAKFFASERIQRCGTTDKPRSTNGAYFWDGKRGWVFNWATEARVQWFNHRNAMPWTDAEKAVWKARHLAAHTRKERQYRQAAMHANQLIRSTTLGTHDYLARKGFPDLRGMIDADGALIVPMRHLETNELLGAQRIYWDEPKRQWVKKMLIDMKAKGAVLRLGDKAAVETFLVEGYATGLSVLAASRSVGLRSAVVVCFSANNLELIAPHIKGRVFVFADNDVSGVGEKAAKATGKHYCMSPIVGEDANDLHHRAGLLAVCQLLMNVRRGVTHG